MRFVRAVGHVARWFAYANALSAALIAIALYDDGWWVAVAALAAIAAAVLWLFSASLFEAAELPGRLRGASGEAGELRRAVEELARARGMGLPRALWRAGRLAAETRELATPWVPLLPLVSGAFLAAAGASVLMTPFALVIALVLLVVA